MGHDVLVGERAEPRERAGDGAVQGLNARHSKSAETKQTTSIAARAFAPSWALRVPTGWIIDTRSLSLAVPFGGLRSTGERGAQTMSLRCPCARIGG